LRSPLLLDRSIIGDTPDTSTVSVTPAICILRSMIISEPAVSATSLRFSGANPGSSTVSV